MCHIDFFRKGIIGEARRRGLKIAWSGDMMSFMPGELGAVLAGLVDVIIYVSAAQRAVLEPGYAAALGALPEPIASDAIAGWIGAPGSAMRVRWVMTGNYIDPAWFPFRDRWRGARRTATSGLSVGRLLRANEDKYPDHFPETYERLGLREPRFRVMT